MPRTKLSQKEKDARKVERAKKKKLQEIEDYKQNGIRLLATDLEDKRKHIADYYPDREPTVFYEVDEIVRYGGHEKTVILEVLDGGKIYRVQTFGRKNRHISNPRDGEAYVHWFILKKMISPEENKKISIFTKDDSIRLNYYQSTISSLLSDFYHSGVNTEPDYQRGLVWEEENKVELLYSIFYNIDIGKFAFIEVPYAPNSPHLEVLDGKQRLLAIIDFYENKFKYNGRYFKDLSFTDQNHFTNYTISKAQISEYPTDAQKYEYFLKLNTGGKPVDKSHMDKVRRLLINSGR